MNMKLRHSSKDVKITVAIWGFLLMISVFAILLLKHNSGSIIERLYSVNVGRGVKANVLYAEADKLGRVLLNKAERLNKETPVKVPIPKHDLSLQRFENVMLQAQNYDPWPEFSSERISSYDLMAQVQDAAGNDVGQRLFAARALMSAGHHDDARELIEKGLNRAPTSEGVVLLAQLNLIEGKTSEALSVLSDMESSESLSPKGLWVQSSAYSRQGRTSEALKSLVKAIDGEPKNLTFRQDYAIILANEGNFKAASQVMQLGLNFGGWLDPAYLHLYGEYLIAAHDLDEGIRILKHADELAPTSGDIQLSLARAYHKAGKAGLAASALRRATEVKPELHDAVFSEK